MAYNADRQRRAKRGRSRIRRQEKYRVTVLRTPRHMRVQLIKPVPTGDEIIVSASTMEEAFKQVHKGYTGNIAAAEQVGRLLAKRALEKGIKQVAFDRSGFQYHGRVKALADAARDEGMEF